MRSRSNPHVQTPRSEPSGAGLVTVLALLLLMGGVDCRSAEAFSRAATGLVQEEVIGATAPRVAVMPRLHSDVGSPGVSLDTSRGERPVMSVSNAMLPAPRAPDHDRVV